MALRVKQYLRAQLRELTKIPVDELVEKRYQRFRKFGVFETEALETASEVSEEKPDGAQVI